MGNEGEALERAMWQRLSVELPYVGDMFVALYSDGSGAEVWLRKTEDTFSGADGAGVWGLECLRENYEWWCLVPRDFKMHSEKRYS